MNNIIDGISLADVGASNRQVFIVDPIYTPNNVPYAHRTSKYRVWIFEYDYEGVLLDMNFNEMTRISQALKLAEVIRQVYDFDVQLSREVFEKLNALDERTTSRFRRVDMSDANSYFQGWISDVHFEMSNAFIVEFTHPNTD